MSAGQFRLNIYAFNYLHSDFHIAIWSSGKAIESQFIANSVTLEFSEKG